jgi:hypothetical protein
MVTSSHLIVGSKVEASLKTKRLYSFSYSKGIYMNFLRRFFPKKDIDSQYSKFEQWIANSLNIPIERLAIDKYYIKDGVWFCHYQFYLDNRTIVDEISELNREWSTERIRSATEEEIEHFEKNS